MVAVTAVLVLLPFALLGIAWGYERVLVASVASELQALGLAVAKGPPGPLPEGTWGRLLGPAGVTRELSAPATGESYSLLGGVFEAGLTLLHAPSPRESLEAVDASLPPLLTREEVREALGGVASGAVRASASGESLVVAWAQPLPSGEVVLLERSNHRGVRQVLLARNQLVKLVLTQLVLALLAAAALGRWLVRPLQQLARGARVFPAGPLAEPALLARPDEFGQVARAFAQLTASLEARRAGTLQLAADLAHELKNPLATIAAAAELMATTRDPSPEKRAALSGTIQEAVTRLQRTVDGLVEEVQLSTPPGATDGREAVDYRGLLEALLARYRADPAHLGFRFEVDVAGDVGLVRLWRVGWERALGNLLDNALVQPTARPVVRVEARLEGDRLITDVIDFGPGVSEGNRAQLFRRFFTARPEGAPRGTGLGLSIVQGVAQAHGGTATLQPAVPGQGAVFRLEVPLVREGDGVGDRASGAPRLP